MTLQQRTRCLLVFIRYKTDKTIEQDMRFLANQYKGIAEVEEQEHRLVVRFNNGKRAHIAI